MKILMQPQTAVVMLMIAAGAANASAQPPERAAANFQTYCAVCHGSAGRPDPDSAMVKALGVVPANFSDALFNSREPAGDFYMVIKHGGAALGLSEQMPAFGDSLSDEEITGLVAYVKTLAGPHDYPPGDLNLFLPLKTKKAFPEDELVWKGNFEDINGHERFTQTLELEQRFGTCSQLVLELSHRIEDSDGKFKSVEFGAKHVLHHNLDQGFIATLAGVVEVPVDDSSVELLPYLAVGKILNDQWTVQGSLRAKLPVDELGNGSMELSGVVHWVHTPWGRAVFPALEFTGDFPFERGSGAGRVDFSHWTVTPQVRIGLTRGGHVALNLGVEVPINETNRFDWRGLVFLIWDFADGPFWAGW